MATFEDFKKLEIRVGKIISAEKVPETDKLVKLLVNFGVLGERQIIAGVAVHFPEPATLVGKKFAFVFNLEPKLIKGLESSGMVLAAGDDLGLSLLTVDDKIAEGSLVE